MELRITRPVLVLDYCFSLGAVDIRVCDALCARCECYRRVLRLVLERMEMELRMRQGWGNFCRGKLARVQNDFIHLGWAFTVDKSLFTSNSYLPQRRNSPAFLPGMIRDYPKAPRPFRYY